MDLKSFFKNPQKIMSKRFESKKPKECSCGCSIKETKNTEDLIRDLINLIAVYKNEEMEDVTTRIDPKTAKELTVKLEKIAKRIGGICN